VNSRSRYMSSAVRLSVVCLSVMFVHPTRAIEIFGNVSTLFGTLAMGHRVVRLHVDVVAVKLQQWPTRGVAVAVGTVSFTLTAEMTSRRAGHLVVTHEWSVRVVDVTHTPLFS